MANAGQYEDIRFSSKIMPRIGAAGAPLLARLQFNKDSSPNSVEEYRFAVRPDCGLRHAKRDSPHLS